MLSERKVSTSDRQTDRLIGPITENDAFSLVN